MGTAQGRAARNRRCHMCVNLTAKHVDVSSNSKLSLTAFLLYFSLKCIAAPLLENVCKKPIRPTRAPIKSDIKADLFLKIDIATWLI